jgi:signal transduction histidine kinase
MWLQISLRLRVYILLCAIVAINLGGGIVLVWYTYRMETLLTSITEKNLAAFQTAQELETALVNQKGFVSYYYLDGDPAWLKQLGEYRQIFKERLNHARELAQTPDERRAITLLEAKYEAYIDLKDRVIAHYMAGERSSGARLHPRVRDEFFQILNLCETYKDLQTDKINNARSRSGTQAGQLRVAAIAAMTLGFGLVVFLTFVLIHHILGPVRRLVAEADRNEPASPPGRSGDEIIALKRKVRGLIEDVDQTHSELRKSRETLLQAEKMALVGRLAAGMAHSIRNPFTSVKMRLFSLDRSLTLSEAQKEDFDVISSEIRHIDTIVQNFLEFSRPPRLQVQPVSPSTVVDLVIQLLEHRLVSYDVEVTVNRQSQLPEIMADPEQLKEVLVNIMVNACEAMGKGGAITVCEDITEDSELNRIVRIVIGDNGPGIPPALLGKVLQPFFTTKEEGTGLGLSIAHRIIEEHGGRLDVASVEGRGATFTITLPLTGDRP